MNLSYKEGKTLGRDKVMFLGLSNTGCELQQGNEPKIERGTFDTLSQTISLLNSSHQEMGIIH